MKQIINSFLILTGAVAVFLVIGVFGGLEGNTFTVGQAYTYNAALLAYIVIARIIYVTINKNAPWCGNTDRASEK